MLKIKENTEFKKIIKDSNTSKLISSKLTEDLELEESSEILSYSSLSLESYLKKKGYRIFNHNDEILGVKNKDLQFFNIKTFVDGSYYVKNQEGEFWFNKDGKRHRDGDQPAVVLVNGKKEWWKDGKCHRDGDQPAMIFANGDKFWWKDDKLHREGDQPAIIWVNGSKSWYKNGKQHRDGDQPAAIYADGSQFWCKNGKLHRDDDKPAAIIANGEEEFWVNGIKIK